MKVDLAVAGPDVRYLSSLARLAEDLGFDALCLPEPGADPFARLARAADRTWRIGLHASVPVPGSPTALAHRAGDLQEYTSGRFVLALAPRPAGCTVSAPARTRRAVTALHTAWRDTRDRPKVFLAAVGPGTAELAGEIADGLILPGFTTTRFLQEMTVPALERGLRRSGRGWDDLEVVAPGLVVTGHTAEERERSARRARRAIAAHGVALAHHPVLKAHGRAALQEELRALAEQGRWSELPGLIDDELLDACAVQGPPGDIPDLLVARYGSVCRRISLTGPLHHDPGTWAAAVSRIHEITCEPVPS
ncbi:LLM class flavin-dependent oxidoreductase [Actinomadura craniellae]|nr:LLM class flavin-dependent oxidoreductase [Actinomadura craniellae]